MAVCEHLSTSIYTDSGNPSHMSNLTTEAGTDTSSEGSASGIILAANKKNKSPTQGTRRSSRLSKGRGELTNNSSDDDSDSDPNIDMGDVLMGHEETLLLEEELIADDKREKQMLAVALVKSVVENQGKSKETGQPMDQQGQQKRPVNMTTQASNGSSIVVKSENTMEMPEDNKVSGGSGGEMPRNVGEIPIVSTSTPSVNVQVPLTLAKAPVAVIATVSNAPNTNVTVVNDLTAQTDQPGRVNVATRSRTRCTKAKTVGLKAQYASIRETPRCAPKPSLPVPNPILSSPAVIRSAPGVKPIVKQPLTRASKVKAHPASRSSTAIPAIKKEPIAMPPSASLPTNLLSGQSVKIEEPMDLVVTSYTQTPTKSNETVSNGAMIPPGRRRIFSIDLDPEGFDFDLSIGVSDYADNSAELPPISSTTYNIRKPSDASAPNDMPPCRDRGMSFELFSFGNSLTLDSSNDLRIEALCGGRPRGDSIIFDPISFSDGGIHEETALQKTRGSFKLDESEELNLLNTTGFVEPPLTPPQVQQSIGISQHGQVSNAQFNRGISSANNIPNPVSVRRTQVNYSGRSKASSGRQTKGRLSTYHHRSGSKAKHHLSVVGGSNMSSGKEDTLHMPQGSAAAAAAAASLSSQILQSTMNGTISHTSCPMELLNKGGRIGIYLPEARRQRISKFHSKRKNRIWRKRIKYDCRKKLADSRPRVKGRFVKSLEPEVE